MFTSLEDRATSRACSSLELRDPLALGIDHRRPRNSPAGRGERPEVDFLALMRRATRILAVTGGLMVAGAVFGGIAGATALGIAVALTDRIANAADFGMLAFAAWFGAIVGAVAAPAAGWLLLRRVPLGRAVGWTTLGAVTGGIGGWLLAIALRSEVGRGLPFLGNAIESGIAGAVVGFVVAAVLARRRSSRHGPIDRVETPVVR